MPNIFDMKPPARHGTRFNKETSHPTPNTPAPSVKSAVKPASTTPPTEPSGKKPKRRTLQQWSRDFADRLPLPKYCPMKRYGPVNVLLTVGVVALLVAGGWFGYRWLTAPARITDIHFERSLSSRTTDAPTKREFTPGEPLMLVMSYAAAKPQTKATILLQKDGQSIRTIDIPHLRGDETTADHGKRYVSLVNGAATKLDPGSYKVQVLLNGSYTAATTTVIVK